MQDNSPDRNENDIANGEQSFANLTSQQEPHIQHNPTNTQASIARQSTRAKYQRMKRQNQQYKQYFKNYLQKQLSCTISQQLMTDPVLISSGFTFDRMNITDWIRAQQKTQGKPNPTCPSSRQPITKTLKSNYAIMKIISDYKDMQQRVNRLNKLAQTSTSSNNNNNNRILISQYEKKNPYLTIDKNKHLLDHSCKPVIMKYFVRVNWRFFQTINLYQCDIDDQSIELLLKHGQEHFKNVVELNLENNKITKIEGLERLPRLKVIYIGQNEKLTEQTKQYLKQINENQPPNRRIKVHFQIQPL